LGHTQYRSWCRHCVASGGVGQLHTSLVKEEELDATVPEVVLDYYFMGPENETVTHLALKDRTSEA